MLKCRFALAVSVFVGAALLTSLPSQAAPRVRMGRSNPAAATFIEKVEQWWSSLLGDGRAPQQERSRGTKNGAGLDPNGEPLCTDCMSTSLPTAPTPTDPSGSN
jgi:hypothetical protein